MPSVLVMCIFNPAGRGSQNELGAINRSYFKALCFCDTVSRRKKIIIVPGTLIGKPWPVYIFRYLKK
jgi:hypothetical protein